MKWIFLILFSYLSLASSAQTLRNSSQLDFILSGNQKVSVLAAEDCSQCYYYLPVNFRLSQNRNNQPEVSFTSWKNDENSEIIGGIFHFLTVWGLTAKQETELQHRLNERLDSTVHLMGPVSLELDPDHLYLEFEGKSEVEDLLSEALTSQARVASTPGSKMALSFRFNESNVNEILKWKDNPKKIKTDLKICLVVSSAYVYKQIELRLPFEHILSVVSE